MNALNYRVYKVYSCLAYAAPLAGLFAINRDVYLSNASTGISFFGYIILAFMAIAFKTKIMEAAKKNTLMTVSIIVFAVALIMQYLAQQLLLISGASIMGCVMSMGFENVSDVYYSRTYQTIADGKKVRINSPTMPQAQAWKAAFGLKYSEV